MSRRTHADASEDPDLLVRLYRRSAGPRLPPRRIRHHADRDPDLILPIAIGIAGRDRAGETLLGFFVDWRAFYWEGSAVWGQRVGLKGEKVKLEGAPRAEGRDTWGGWQ
jgi:hypothetical protein